MFNIKTILAALFCTIAPFAAIENRDPKTEVVQSNFKLGKETIASIRSSYEAGKYNDFLTEMDELHRKADKTNLIEMRKNQIPLETQEDWEQQLLDLQKEKNNALLYALSDKDDSLFAQKVRSAAANIATAEQEKAISRLNSLIAMAPGSGQNEDENQLIAIDLEYEQKALQVSDISFEKRQEYQIALRMEKMDLMLKASKFFQDQSLKQAVTLAADHLDARLARNLDGADLNDLMRAKQKPSNEAEGEILSILSSYQGKFTDLLKQIDQSLSK